MYHADSTFVEGRGWRRSSRKLLSKSRMPLEYSLFRVFRPIETRTNCRARGQDFILFFLEDLKKFHSLHSKLELL